MRIVTTLISLGVLALISTLPAAGESNLLLRSAPSPFQLAASGDSTTSRDTFTQKVRNEMLEWRRNLHEFSEKAEAKGKDAYNAAVNDLDEAWTKAEAASRKLQTVGDEGWESAKIDYEKASYELAEVWHKIHSGEK